VVIGPNDRKGNMIARYRGKPGSALRPILIIGHLDVVEARREDWTTDPFKFVEQDGYFYGRGTQDMKEADAIAVTDFIRLKKEGYVPNRDIILALTADEEGGKSNGVDWLLQNHRDLIDAEFVLNPDSGGVTTDHGKPLSVEFEATEKLYADYQVLATNPGGHSSLPKPDNAIYHVADALGVLEKSPFPFELNAVTREYFGQMAKIETAQAAADMRAILREPPDPAAIQRLSQDARYNSTLRTTCVATMLSGGHAPNALPQRAEANVNCRIFPGHSQEDIRLALIRLFNDPKLTVRYRSDAGELTDQGSDRKAMVPPPLRADVMDSLRKVAAKLWPGAPVMPTMVTGSSDSIYTMNAGIPSYGINGIAIDRDDVRMHGKDERVKVASYYTGVEFYYQFLKALTAVHP
jgi:acetylornithine deacetylase/succinyl-diaminopimelate desuccinylase-like protein